MDDQYLTASEAAGVLGVSIQTLYVYVGRKGIRTERIRGTRFRRYWKADIERVKAGALLSAPPGSSEPAMRSEITFLTGGDTLYRGRSATDLARHASFESVAALLWAVEEKAVFSSPAPLHPPLAARLRDLLAKQAPVDRITAILPFLEAANPHAFDLSPSGTARTGVDVLRSLAALTVNASRPSDEPIHLFIARHLRRPRSDAELIRQMLVLSADHGFEAGALVARAVASRGVTLWRVIGAALSASIGHPGQLGVADAIYQLLDEIANSHEPERPIIQRVRDGALHYGFEAPTYGQGEPIYGDGDPRARTLFELFDRQIGDEPDFRRLKKALLVALDIANVRPNNALMCLFLYRRLGLGSRSPLFHLGRAAGWIAHAREQHQTGEVSHVRGLYTGPPSTPKDAPRGGRSS